MGKQEEKEKKTTAPAEEAEGREIPKWLKGIVEGAKRGAATYYRQYGLETIERAKMQIRYAAEAVRSPGRTVKAAWGEGVEKARAVGGFAKTAWGKGVERGRAAGRSVKAAWGEGVEGARAVGGFAKTAWGKGVERGRAAWGWGAERGRAAWGKGVEGARAVGEFAKTAWGKGVERGRAAWPHLQRAGGWVAGAGRAAWPYIRKAGGKAGISILAGEAGAYGAGKLTALGVPEEEASLLAGISRSAGIGGAIGSFVPGVGTGIGAILGGMWGASKAPARAVGLEGGAKEYIARGVMTAFPVVGGAAMAVGGIKQGLKDYETWKAAGASFTDLFATREKLEAKAAARTENMWWETGEWAKATGHGNPSGTNPGVPKGGFSSPRGGAGNPGINQNFGTGSIVINVTTVDEKAVMDALDTRVKDEVPAE
jgi:hypothetical protein